MTETPRPADLTRDDFALIGEVIVHASTLENMLVVLAAVLLWHRRSDDGSDVEQTRQQIRDRVLGESPTVVLKACRAHQELLTSVAPADYLTNLWDDCTDLFERRNAVAHSFWQRMPDGRVVAMRALPKHKRTSGVDYQAVGGTLGQLAELRDQVGDAIADIKQLLDERWPDAWPEYAAFSLRERAEGAAMRQRKSASGRKPE